MISGPWVRTWKQRMVSYARKKNIAIPAGLRTDTIIWGNKAELLAKKIKTSAGIANANGKLDGQLRKILYGMDLNNAGMLPPFLGIDVSNNNGAIDWALIPDTYKFVYAKATQGDWFIDTYYAANKEGAQERGFKFGAYLFLEADTPSGVIKQVDHFLEIAKYNPATDLLPVLDWENTRNSVVNIPDQAATLEAAVRYLKNKIGKYPVIYSNAYVLEANRFSRLSIVGKCPLWISAYGRDDGTRYPNSIPFVPKPWRGWDIHQYTSAGTVPGIDGHCDINHSAVPMNRLR